MLNGLDNRELPLYDLFCRVSYIKKAVSKEPEGVVPHLYWKGCALLELSELLQEFPVEIWKEDHTLNTVHIKFEVVDVVCHLISSLLVDTNKSIDWSVLNNYIVRIEHPVTTYSENRGLGINTYVALSAIIVNKGFSYKDMNYVITTLCELSNIDHATFSSAFIAKMALVFCRLKDGKYIEGWHKKTKLNSSQEDLMQEAIDMFELDTDATLDSLFTEIVENVAPRFIY